jgi:hypothetical protein
VSLCRSTCVSFIIHLAGLGTEWTGVVCFGFFPSFLQLFFQLRLHSLSLAHSLAHLLIHSTTHSPIYLHILSSANLLSLQSLSFPALLHSASSHLPHPYPTYPAHMTPSRSSRQLLPSYSAPLTQGYQIILLFWLSISYVFKRKLDKQQADTTGKATRQSEGNLIDLSSLKIS